jgi:SpoVK/Ycf46/Vps4 family AAA+-type ATPase
VQYGLQNFLFILDPTINLAILLKELDLPLLKVTSTELVSGVSGQSEENIRNMFEKAIVCLIFLPKIFCQF